MISAATCSVVFCMTTTRTACMCMRCLWRIKWRRAIPFKPQRFSLTEVLPYIETFLRMFLFLTPKIAIIRLPVQSKGEKVAENKELGKLKERPLLWERGADFAPEDVATPTISTIKSQQGDETLSRTKGQSNASSAGKSTVNSSTSQAKVVNVAKTKVRAVWREH